MYVQYLGRHVSGDAIAVVPYPFQEKMIDI